MSGAVLLLLPITVAAQSKGAVLRGSVEFPSRTRPKA
jgi:hypothetical protein